MLFAEVLWVLYPICKVGISTCTIEELSRADGAAATINLHGFCFPDALVYRTEMRSVTP